MTKKILFLFFIIIFIFSNLAFATSVVFITIGTLINNNTTIVITSVIKVIPLSSIILETDSPYLTPEPYRGSRNDPSNIIEIAKETSDHLAMFKQEIIRFNKHLHI